MPTSEEATRLLQLSRDAYDRGDVVLHLPTEVSRLTGQPSSWGSSENDFVSDDHVGYFLSEVERIGWRLEHTGYTFVESGATTSARMLSSGTGVVNHGHVAGYFTFRRITPSA
ncbi:hypothetical protein J7E68_00330 [Microbacterium sp. ISL-103]|uniref:hypothetical protein n=1 Tax=Microbacterium sp. ISL-103 TaxID=2819156 RepID=UPI001BE8F769|nr:hypothetical protein [Microbacterium sp. ISL-103]MBT2473068.1 hypothetical protein [Microbacterium sp. ISL-103]